MSYSIHEPATDPNGMQIADGGVFFGETVTIVSGQNLVAGAVVGQITSGGKYALSAAAASDGSQTPVGVLASACDASGGDKQAFVFYEGAFNAAKLTFGAGHTAAALRRTCAQRGLRFYTPR